jgi:hypothetical protein
VNVSITPDLKIVVNGSWVGHVERTINGGIAVIDHPLWAAELRAIADKLDELNGEKSK